MMKQFLLAMLVVLYFTGTYAQQSPGQQPYYYFGKTKVTLQHSTATLYVRLDDTNQQEITSLLAKDFKISKNAVRNIQSSRFFVIEIPQPEKEKTEAVMTSISAIGSVQLARPALVAPDGKEVIIDESFYVKLKPGVTFNQLTNLALQKNCEIEKAYPSNDRTWLLKAGAANHFDGLTMANTFYETGLFEFAEPDFRLLDALHAVPNDPLFNLQWSAINTGAANQGSGTLGADIDLDEAWDISMGNASIKIAVLDEGVQRAHPDLVNNISPLGFGLVAGNANSGEILSTARSHGTSCAGIIAAEANNNIGIAGIAPLSKLIPVNITINAAGTFGTSAQIAQAIDWAWNTAGADILSNSWGGGTASSLIQDAIRRATTLGRGGKGALVIFSSGNNNSGVASPACFSETIAVGAMSMCFQRKSGNSCDNETFWGGNYGTGLDISAPGVRIATTRVTGTGTAPNADYNLAFNGTSSAAPIVSGVAALILSVNSNFTQAQVREILERTAKKGGGYPYSMTPGQPNGTWTSELGHGMVNAKNALLAAQAPAFCRVEAAAAGGLQVCSGGTVPLQVTNHTAGNTYQWRKDGIIVGGGQVFNATLTGNYDVVLTSSTGCKDSSFAFAVNISAPQGPLLANAGRDTSLCVGSSSFLGGGPAGRGGTGIIHPMRALASDITNNTFLRFDPLQPSLNYQTIKTGFIPAPVTDEFYSGAASTPYGIYMINRINKMLVRIDTANGSSYTVGLTTSSAVSFSGMTYDATTDKIFACATSGTVNNLYEINRLTGAATLVNAISGIAASNVLISLSADNSGQLYGMRLSTLLNVSAQLMSINKVTGAAIAVGNTGFLANFAQGGDVDPLTDELYQAAGTSVLGSTANYNGKGLWKLNKSTGFATLIGSIAQPFNSVDALSFANKEYRYQWSPTVNLSNPNDANPLFTATTAGTFVYTLTVTDLCGNTATDQVSLVVNAAPPMPSISPSNPVLSHRNSFRDTLTYTQQAGLIYDWVENGSLLGNATNNLPLSFLNSSFSQYTVRITNPTTGCVSNTAPVSFSYAPGVLLNNNSALTVCDSSFYDIGGPTGPTGNNFTRTFTPSTPGTKLKLTIYNLDLANFATLFVYDGDNSGAPRIIALDQTSNGSSAKTFTASNPDGILTIRFSLGTFQSSGWLAGLTCEQPLQYRSIANGQWLNSNNWESKVPAASLWTPAFRHPNKGDDSIAIRHDITISEELQIDDVLVTAAGKLLLENNGYINLYKVKPSIELSVEAGAMVKVNTGSFIFGTGIIELKGTLQNEGAITADNLIVNGTLPQQLINSTGNASSISRLTMNNAAGLTTVGMHNVDALSLNSGLINTSANNTLRLDNTSAGNDNAYINGPVHFLGRSGMNKILPIGKNGAYRPVILSASSADGEGSATLKAEVIHGAPPTRTFPAGVSNVSSVRYYQLSAIENSVNLRDFAITLPYGIDDAVANPASLKIVKDNGAAAWLDLGGAATGPAPGTITSEPFNSFSDFVLANVVAGPLPVSLLSFTGRWNNDKPVLNWRVENEMNLSRYEIERGSTPSLFLRIGVVNAFNLTSTAYQFIDEQSTGNRVFYRLKMIDANGDYRYSNIIELDRSAIFIDRIISISPHPFQSHITVQYQSRDNQTLSLQLFDSKGRLMKQFGLNVVEGVNQLYIEASALAAGTYILHLKTAIGTIRQKIIKG